MTLNFLVLSQTHVPWQAWRYTVLPNFGLSCKTQEGGHAGRQIRVIARTGLYEVYYNNNAKGISRRQYKVKRNNLAYNLVFFYNFLKTSASNSARRPFCRVVSLNCGCVAPHSGLYRRIDSITYLHHLAHAWFQFTRLLSLVGQGGFLFILDHVLLQAP